MNSTLKIGGGVAAACAACGAIAIVPALLAGTSLAAIGGAIAWELGLVVLAGVAAAGVYHFLRRRPAAKPNATVQSATASTPEDGCGCGPSCSTSAKPDETTIACTLDAGDFKERAAGIRDLARRSLRHTSRTALTLTLTYAPEALHEVRELVAKEQQCCAFLHFDLASTTDAVLLTVTAPPAAAEAADALFDHFAPDVVTPKRRTPSDRSQAASDRYLAMNARI